MRFLLFLHVLAGAVWLGATVLEVVAGRSMMGRDLASKVSWTELEERLGLRLSMPSAIVVLLTGIGMVLHSDVYGFATPFVAIGLTAVILLSVLGAAVFEPRAAVALAAYRSGDEAAGDGALSGVAPLGYVDLAIFAVTFAAMVWRWGV